MDAPDDQIPSQQDLRDRLARSAGGYNTDQFLDALAGCWMDKLILSHNRDQFAQRSHHWERRARRAEHAVQTLLDAVDLNDDAQAEAAKQARELIDTASHIPNGTDLPFVGPPTSAPSRDVSVAPGKTQRN